MSVGAAVGDLYRRYARFDGRSWRSVLMAFVGLPSRHLPHGQVRSLLPAGGEDLRGAGVVGGFAP